MKNLFDDVDYSSMIDERNKYLFSEKIFSRNMYTSKANKMYGGISPDEVVLNLINAIGTKDNNLENIIKNHSHYLHNRVGTILTDAEKKNKISDNKTDFTPGLLVAFAKDSINYEFVIFKSFTTDQKAEIIKITKDINGKIKNSDIMIVELAAIEIVNEQIKQSYKPNQKINEDELLETYEINF